MEPLRRVSPREAESLIELSIYDEKVCTKAIAFSLTDVEEGIYPASSLGTAWQKVTYYADDSSINNTSLSPLEYMYKEWDMNKDSTDERN